MSLRLPMRVILLLALWWFTTGSLHAGDGPPRHPTNIIAGFTLPDQHDMPRSIAFPATNATVLIVTDRKGSKQVADWLSALVKYPHHIVVRGLADLGGAPGFVHGRIRRHFQETYQEPIMLDWSGKVCAQLGYEPGVANVLIVRPDGTILTRVAGPAEETNRDLVFQALDRARSNPNSTPQAPGD